MFLLLTAAAAPATSDTADSSGGAPLALLVLIVIFAMWFGLRQLVRSLRAGKTQAATGGDFTQYALESLCNAAKIDGRVNESEKQAIVHAMREIGGEAFEAIRVDQAFAQARLNKAELVAFLASRSTAFTRDQKVSLLKALMAVFVADGKFDETEHHALVEYTAAVGFDRQSAPNMLRSLAGDFKRGNIT